MNESERDKRLHSSGVNHLPLPRGRYKVGCVDVLNGGTRDRGCLFRIFYPCEENVDIPTESSRRATWLPKPERKYADGYARVQGHVAYCAHKLCGSQTSSLYIPATMNARPARENRNAFPVILFSHDIGECRTTNSSLCVELASHGCVVAAIEHRDNTACRTFYVEQVEATPGSKDQLDGLNGVAEDREETSESLQTEDEIPMCESALEEDQDKDSADGDSVLADDVGGDKTDSVPRPAIIRTVWVNYRPIAKTPDLYNLRVRQLHRRVGECIRTLNCLEVINARGTCDNRLPERYPFDLSGTMNMERVTVIGRGFGGSTAYMTLQIEDRTICGASIDPLMFVIKADRPINVCRPFLLVLNSRHTAREDVQIMRTMFRQSYKTYTSVYTLLGSDTDAQSDLPFIKASSVWSSLSFSWPMVAPSPFTSLDLGSSLVLKFISEKCNFNNHNRDFYEDYVQRKSNLIEKGVRMPNRWTSRYSNAR
ncbi:platelet-activating factor acetylhydrolase [Galendromus occidentalis]|uniref:1-alkyl-2-acetylglycerophosphocholine esterase n=1 Tax=Galendromus occidentalis TaxID=34638 RepID=A0AAJ6QP44_9ACAR|nr:platelet-activating factor acetylhydrolase [Galendromus occidentalis]